MLEINPENNLTSINKLKMGKIKKESKKTNNFVESYVHVFTISPLK